MTFHQDVCKQGLQDFISELQIVSRGISECQRESRTPNVEQMIDGLKNYIDKKFGDIDINLHTKFVSYTVPIKINIGNNKGLVEYVEIQELDTVQSILNKIYFLLDYHVKPYTYMSSWVLKEIESDAYMIMYEVTSLVPAKYIFRPDIKWEVVKWDDSYNAANSKYHGGAFNW